LLLGFLSPIALYTSRFLGARAVKAQAPIDGRKQAEELNQLASTIETPADARRFVDFLADIFSRDAPSGWTRNSLRNLIAQAEFAAVSDPQKTIPKARLAEAWNRYVDTLQAPGDQKVTAEELHNLRDAIWTSARLAWKGNRGNDLRYASRWRSSPGLSSGGIDSAALGSREYARQSERSPRSGEQGATLFGYFQERTTVASVDSHGCPDVFL